MPTTRRFPRGSEWRKWDLHLHAPGTKKNDGYKAASGDLWDEYCKRLESSDVQVFGITDYFSADCYFNTIKEFGARYPTSSKTFLPNLELRTNDAVNKAGEEVNVHLIFNPAYADQARDFLAALRLNKTDENERDVTASQLRKQVEYERATTTRQSIRDALVSTFGRRPLTDKVLIITAVNNDGLRVDAKGPQRKRELSDELDKFSDGFFGNSKNTPWFLGKSRLDGGQETDPKPVLAGCDSHSFVDLDQWLGKTANRDGQIYKQPTWIKADPTFEGLRQILFEPAGRVFIGDEPEVLARVSSHPRRYLKELRVSQVVGYKERLGAWFKNERIELNKELVAIIGNKGSGKSALADILGLLGNSHNQRYERSGNSEELFSFLNKEKFLKTNCASNFEAEVDWYAGQPDKARLDSSVDTSLPERLEYLPQKYLEKICANIDDDEFRHKLNEVIFRYVKEDDRFGKSSLDELVGYLGVEVTEEVNAALASLHEHNVRVVDLERKVAPDHKRETENRIKLKEAELAAHLAKPIPLVAKPTEVDAVTAGQLARIDQTIKELNETIYKYEQEKPHVAKEAEDLKQARQSIERHAAALQGLEHRYKSLFERAGIQFGGIVQLALSYESLDTAIRERQQRVNELVSFLLTPEEIEALSLPSLEAQAQQVKGSLVCQRQELEEQRKTIVDRLGKADRDYQNHLRIEQQWQARKLEMEGADDNPAVGTLKWLRSELTNITEAFPGQVAAARAERDVCSREVFRKKKKLVDFYTAVKHSIDAEIARYRNDLHGYAISIEAGLRMDSVFDERFWSFISQVVKGSFHGGEEGKSQLAKLKDQVLSWDEEEGVFNFLDSVLRCLDKDRRPNLGEKEDRARDIFRQLKDKRDPVDFYDFVFGLDYLKLKYDLKVDEKDLSELSPGERGGLLLVFYLMLDKRDIPLVIDQPEDNLDNKSVYEILVTFLKKAKARRQIIIATHNPNLAVVADAEQIIHVTIDKSSQVARNDFDFTSGALEDLDINDRVVEILEGTMPAFDNRRLKYRKRKTAAAETAIE